MSCCEGKATPLPSTAQDEAVKDAVKDYYGKKIKKTDDLLTSACLTSGKPAEHVKKALSLLHEEILSTYYGCGLVFPEVVQGMRILDLGSGSGRDCFVLSKLVGEKGFVVGVDMTDEQLALANKHIDYHTKAFGYSVPNVVFKKGYIERLGELGLQENSFDIIVSNCVINLSPEKRAVLEGAFRLLKPGGELYFSDVYSDRRVPTRLTKDPVLWGECLTGALYWNDFLQLANAAGFMDPRLVSAKRIALTGKIADLLEPIKFYSAEYRLFKLANLERDCEDYGQAIRYKGTADNGKEFRLDSHHTFATGKIYPVCGNSFLMLKESRLAQHFDFFGDVTNHFGLFPGCGKQNPLEALATGGATPAAAVCC